jgi:membrane protease subunit HflK
MADAFNSGLTILRVELQDVVPPPPVRPSFNEVNESRQERERMINEAERARNQVVPRAQGEARQIISQSEGYAAERVNRAKGEAGAFLELLSAYAEAPEVTRQRLYLETLDRVLSRVGSLYIIEGGQSAPLPLLNLGATPATNTGGK